MTVAYRSTYVPKAVARPGQAAALAWLWPTARLKDLESQSPPGPSQSRGFQAKPGRNITTGERTLEDQLKYRTIDCCLVDPGNYHKPQNFSPRNVIEIIVFKRRESYHARGL